MATIAQLIEAQAANDGTGLLFEDDRWTWREYVQACAERAALLRSLQQPGPPHVGVLLENVPEYAMWLGAAALTRSVIVGINPTRRGAELARDITHADCQLIVTDSRLRHDLDGLDLGLGPDRVLVVDEPSYAGLLEPHRGAALEAGDAKPRDLYLLLFTSGTSGAPKAVRCTQGRLAGIGQTLSQTLQLGTDDVVYLAMPMFHSNALMAGWAPAITVGTAVALRRKFSASGFLPDVRAFGVTYFNYVGKPLSYILATPERPDDADNTLRQVFGNEATHLDMDRFAARFGCTVVDGYGSTEGGASAVRTVGMPPGAIGQVTDTTTVLDPATGEECPVARFDERGRLLNAEEAIGEIVNKAGGATFEGYWKNEEADAERVRDGCYWTGDLGYRDEKGFLYFAGRGFDWLRVDGENFAAAPVEGILARHPDVVLSAVYAVPDPIVGDQVMAALQLRPGASFDPEAFAAFLAAQDDLGTKWAPSFVRISPALPVTETAKVLKRQLRRERWECGDEVWWRPERDRPYHRFDASDAAALRRRFEERGRLNALEAV